MSVTSKQDAYKKLELMTFSIGYDNWIEDDIKLDEYYNKQDVTVISLSGNQKPFDHSIMGATANYFLSKNHIYIPLGIISDIFFDNDFPVAAQYGALGSLLGHEITHGFDTRGIEWDGEGHRSRWMDKQSVVGFNKMADCLFQQYRKFNAYPEISQGENVADNGGIRISYNAFISHQGLHGAEPRLPHPVFKDFTHEQLFFLSFSHIYCSQKPLARSSPHAPQFYRVMGSIQNFPAFQAAFNCPMNSKYTPNEHCTVWA